MTVDQERRLPAVVGDSMDLPVLNAQSPVRKATATVWTDVGIKSVNDLQDPIAATGNDPVHSPTSKESFCFGYTPPVLRHRLVFDTSALLSLRAAPKYVLYEVGDLIDTG